MPTIHQHHGRTDGRTTYDSNTALAQRASRAKAVIGIFGNRDANKDYRASEGFARYIIFDVNLPKASHYY